MTRESDNPEISHAIVRIGGRRTAVILIGTAVTITLVVAVVSLIVWQTRGPRPPASGTGATVHDSARVLWSRWTDGKPNTFRVRVRMYRQDHQPVSVLQSPSLIDTGTNAPPNLFGSRTYFENWTSRGPGNSVEVTVRAQLAATPTAPVSLGFQVLDSAPAPPMPWWSRLLGPLYSPPPPPRWLQRLKGEPALLQPPRGQQTTKVLAD